MELLNVTGTTAKVLTIAFMAMVGTNALAAEYKAGEVIVKYKNSIVRNRAMANALYNKTGVKKVKRYSQIMEGFEHLVLNEKVKVEDALAKLKESDLVEYAQPNYILHALAKGNDSPIPGMPQLPCIPDLIEPPMCDPNAKMPCLMPGMPFPPGCEDGGGGGGGGGCILPGFPPGCEDGGGGGGGGGQPVVKPDLKDAPADVNPPVADPNMGQSWGLAKSKATEAWAVTKGTKDIIVADIDTGIDYNHEDLAFNIWRNPNPTNGDTVGYDFVHNDGLPWDDNEHGTHTAGTIGAVGGNGIGTSGVAQRVSLMGLKFLSGQGSGTTADAIRAIDYAIEHGARVLSNSWGGASEGEQENKVLYDAIERAKAKDVLFIAAAGNDGQDNDNPANASYPAAFDNDNLISVAATDESDTMAFFSNYGKKTTHLAAPGVNVYSTTPGNKYAAHSGTSMACPHVAGAAAMVLSVNPKLTYKDVKAILLKSVDPLVSLNNKTVTGGRLNVMKAVSTAKTFKGKKKRRG
jgi:subtilisin family serine protease